MDGVRGDSAFPGLAPGIRQTVDTVAGAALASSHIIYEIPDATSRKRGTSLGTEVLHA
jgi:hypothetical protein